MNRMLYTYGAIVSAGTIAFAGYELIDWHCLTATEWAAWVGAIGTLLAFAGTIWIASAETRRRNDDAISLATITLHSLLEKIGSAQGGLIFVHRKFAFSRPRRLIIFGEIAEKLDRLQSISLEEITNLIPLGKDIAMNLTRARTQVEMARKVAIGLHEKRVTIKDMDEAIKTVSDGVDGAMELLNKVMPHIVEMELEHDPHGDVL